jgi:hypothetical protein
VWRATSKQPTLKKSVTPALVQMRALRKTSSLPDKIQTKTTAHQMRKKGFVFTSLASLSNHWLLLRDGKQKKSVTSFVINQNLSIGVRDPHARIQWGNCRTVSLMKYVPY